MAFAFKKIQSISVFKTHRKLYRTGGFLALNELWLFLLKFNIILKNKLAIRILIN